MSKKTFAGTLAAVQPRIRLHRSFDQRHHSYQGYVLRVDGQMDAWERRVNVAIGEAAHEKHQFRAGDQITGEGEFVTEPRTEVADLYKAAKFKVVSRAEAEPSPGPPRLGVPPALEVYLRIRDRSDRSFRWHSIADSDGIRSPVPLAFDR